MAEHPISETDGDGGDDCDAAAADDDDDDIDGHSNPASNKTITRSIL